MINRNSPKRYPGSADARAKLQDIQDIHACASGGRPLVPVDSSMQKRKARARAALLGAKRQPLRRGALG